MTGTPRAPWTPEQDKQLRALVLSANSVDTIAKALNHTAFAVRRRANTLRLPLRKIVMPRTRIYSIGLSPTSESTRRERRRERGATLEQLPMSSQSSRFVLRHQIFEWLRRLLEEGSIEFRDSLRFRYERFICVLCVFALNLHQLGGHFNTGQLRSEFRSMLH